MKEKKKPLTLATTLTFTDMKTKKKETFTMRELCEEVRVVLRKHGFAPVTYEANKKGIMWTICRMKKQPRRAGKQRIGENKHVDAEICKVCD